MFLNDRPSYTVDGTLYTIEEELGTGGFATAYKALSPNQEPVTLKTYGRWSPGNLETVRKGFETRKRHPEIPDSLVVQAINHDLWFRIFGQGPSAVFTYVEGEDALEELEQPLDIISRVRKGRSLLYRSIPALDALIQSGLVHHDLKPSNLIFPQHQNPAIFIDTDLITSIGDEPDETYIGNPPGMPPEYLSEFNINLTYDIYSLACEILYRYMDKETQRIIDIGAISVEELDEADPEQLRTILRRMIKKRIHAKATGDHWAKIRLRDISRFPDEIQTEAYGLIEFLIAALHPDPRCRPKNGKEITQLLQTKPS